VAIQDGIEFEMIQLIGNSGPIGVGLGPQQTSLALLCMTLAPLYTTV